MLDDKDEFVQNVIFVSVPKSIQELYHVHPMFMTDRAAYWISLGGKAASVEDIILAGADDLMIMDRHA